MSTLVASPPVLPADHQAMLERGFVWVAPGFYHRSDIGPTHMDQYVELLGKRDPAIAKYWIATAVLPSGDARVVVRYADAFDSPLVAFITAEIRGWVP
ncbi:hypothetical protein D3C81_759360 [compost metagenome]